MASQADILKKLEQEAKALAEKARKEALRKKKEAAARHKVEDIEFLRSIDADEDPIERLIAEEEKENKKTLKK